MKTVSSLAIVAALLASACAPKVNDPADVKAITQLMDGYFQSAGANDPAALQAVLTSKTTLFEPHMAPLAGKDAIGDDARGASSPVRTDAKGPVAGRARRRRPRRRARHVCGDASRPKDTTLAAAQAPGTGWPRSSGRPTARGSGRG